MSRNDLPSKSAGISLLAALVASLCCITPVFSLLAGIGGIAATFSWMEPFRPYLITLTIGVLGFAWYQKLKTKTVEEIACDCEKNEKPSFFQSRKFLGVITVFAGIMLTFPSYSFIFYPDTKIKEAAAFAMVKVASFDIEGMTCTGCEEHVKFATTQLEGVLEANSSFESGTALIKFEPTSVTLEEITEAINATGYTVIKTEVFDIDDDSSLK